MMDQSCIASLTAMTEPVPGKPHHETYYYSALEVDTGGRSPSMSNDSIQEKKKKKKKQEMKKKKKKKKTSRGFCRLYC